MNLQGALSDLMKVFLAFYIGCCAVGRGDLPVKLVAELRTSALKGTSSKAWGCASIFNRGGDCMTYDPAKYK